MITAHVGAVQDCPACNNDQGRVVPERTADHAVHVLYFDHQTITPHTFIGPRSGPTGRPAPAPEWVPFLNGEHPAWSQEWIDHVPATVCYGAQCADTRCHAAGWTLEPLTSRHAYYVGIFHDHPEPELDLFAAMGVSA